MYEAYVCAKEGRCQSCSEDVRGSGQPVKSQKLPYTEAVARSHYRHDQGLQANGLVQIGPNVLLGVVGFDL